MAANAQSSASLLGTEGPDTLVIDGVVEGDVSTGGGADTITASGTITGAILLGDGSDLLTLTGAVGGLISGGPREDVFILTPGATYGGIDGGAGSDVLVLDGPGQGALLAPTSMENLTVRSGTWVIADDQSYTQAVTVSGGTLQIGNGGTGGSIATQLYGLNGGTLAFNQSDTVHFAGPLTGSGSIVQLGSGLLVLENSRNGTVNVVIQNGEVEIASVNAASSVRFGTSAGETLTIRPGAFQASNHEFAPTLLGFGTHDAIHLPGIDPSATLSLGFLNVLSINGTDGAHLLRFDPAASFSGRTFRLTSDGEGGSLLLLGASNNLPPKANSADYIATEGTAITRTLTASTVDFDPVTFSIVSGPEHGTLTVDETGRFTFTSDVGYSGTDSFVFRASDGFLFSQATISFTINPNLPPVVSGPATANAVEGALQPVGILAFTNVSDPNPFQPLHVVDIPELPPYVTYDATTFRFSLDPRHPGLDHIPQGTTEVVSVSFGIFDGVATTPHTVQWLVAGRNDAPVLAGPLRVDSVEDGEAATVDLLGGASDPDSGSTLTILTPLNVLGGTYDAASHRLTLDPGHPAWDSLRPGEVATRTYAFTISDGITTAQQTLTWKVVGVNDAPVVSGAVTGSVGENAGPVSLDALARSTDVDHPTLTVVGIPSLPPFVSYDAASHSFRLDGSNPAFEHLAQGQAQVVVISYGVSDGLATTDARVEFTVLGANDAPTVAAPLTGSAGEGAAPLVIDALAGAADVDDATVLQVVGLPAELPAGVTYNAATHSFAFDPAHAAYDSLPAGESVSVTVSYGVSDGVATVPQSVRFTVTGANDAPVVHGSVDQMAAEGGPRLAVDALSGAFDIDRGATLFVVDVPAELPAGVSFDPATQTFTLDASHPAYEALVAGQSLTLSVAYGVSDGEAMAAQVVNFTLNGTNDAPVVSAPLTAAASEGGPPVRLDALAGASDVDAGAVLTVVGLPAGLPAGVTYDAATHSFTFDPAHAAYDGLGAGQTQVVSVSYAISDGLAAAAQTASWTVTGSNDAPSARADTGAVTNNQSVVLDVLGNDTDRDSGDSRTIVSVGPTTLGGHATVGTGGIVYLADAAAFDDLAEGETVTDTFSYTMRDAAGALSSAQVTVTVTGGYTPPVVASPANGSGTLNGGAGNDVLTGGNGATVINAGAGDDRVAAGNGSDVVYGGRGADTVDSGNGNDVIDGGDGGDSLTGGNGNDVLLGGAGTDKLSGGNGADTLTAGAGDDLLFGGNGADRFVFGEGFGRDAIADFERGDLIAFDDAVFDSFADVLGHARQVGEDVVITTDAGEVLTLQGVGLGSLRSSDFLFV